MKALTLHQPWASLIALGVKTIETRPLKTNVRGRIAIHAAARIPHQDGIGDWKAFRLSDAGGWFVQHFAAGEPVALPADGEAPLPLGAIVATANLVDCVPMVADSDVGDERPLISVTEDAGGVGAFLWHRGMPGWPYEEGTSLKDQVPYGHFAPGRWAWLLEDIEPLDIPVPFKGGQGWSRSWSPS